MKEYPEFQKEALALLRIRNPSLPAIEATTVLKDALDSLGIVELITAAEEYLKIELSFEEVKGAATWWDLQDIISAKGGGC